ncbi:methyltransferase [Pseudohaliea rubra]|uniref:Hydroxyneurosporene methyltransferase n=1 Tax=Pseudohaliea rubra DSM 19751 TaxID=1265313 RepID=A0A095X2V9_9GAMM|nr:methyltransferase [Pseudohaliea rubra]KGE05199.1 Hydroxyneurosporene methyltransferase [Pseudohaliea rubra DSM 19751]
MSEQDGSQAATVVSGPPARPGGLRKRFLCWRDRLLGNPSFHRFAARFPLTRPIARQRARGLFDLSAGFVYSQILFACVRAGLFDLLADGPRSTASIASATGLPEEGALRLLRGAVALRLVQPAGAGYWRLGVQGAVMLGNPSIGAMVSHHERLYADLADPLALLGGRAATNLARLWPYAAGERDAMAADEVAAYSELMAASQSLLSEDVLDACGAGDARHWLDVGGGEGVFLSAALRRNSALQGTVLDLPQVATRARERLLQCGLAARAEAVGGDMFKDPWPPGADTISLVRVLHDHDDAPARALVARAREALPPRGRLVIAEPMAGTRGAEAMGDGYFGFYLWAMGSGRPRTAGELRRWVLEAGFDRCRELKTAQPMLARVLVAERDRQNVK